MEASSLIYKDSKKARSDASLFLFKRSFILILPYPFLQYFVFLGRY